MFLIVGLGNPGSSYEMTRHNVGFIAVDFLSNCYNFLWQLNNKFDAEIAKGDVCDIGKVVLCKPMTFMNLSGKAVQSICAFYKLSPENIIVVHDDIDLPIGTLKYKIGGGNGGHNGLRSIDSIIGKNYHRIRIGIGRPENFQHDVSDYVLGKFTDTQIRIMNECIKKISLCLPDLLLGRMDEFIKMLRS